MDNRNLRIFDAEHRMDQMLGKYKKVLVSVSGGKDSDVMLDMVRRSALRLELIGAFLDEDPFLSFVFFDTGIEYVATKDHLDGLEYKYGVEIERVRAVEPVAAGCSRHGLPFISKFVSEMVDRLQSAGFDFARDGLLPFDELMAKYPRCGSALRWWCGENGEGSRFGINRFRCLKEFMIENPPTFRISQKCCSGAKKETAARFEREERPDLVMVGLRRSENGIRSSRISGCFDRPKGEGPARFRPLWWLTDGDIEEYCREYGVTHSLCYTEYGLKRTGCAGCPFGSRFEEELEAIKDREPRLRDAVCRIFGPSYDYIRAYREFKKRKG